MSSPSIHLAEEALALPPELRVQLARLLIESLEGNSRTDAEIAGMLRLRLADLQNGKDTGLSFEQVFGEPALRSFSAPASKPICWKRRPATERFPNASAEIHERVKEVVRTIIARNGGDHVGPHGFPCRACRPFPYAVCYLIEKDSLHVLGLVHDRRHPDFLKARRQN